VTTRLVPGDSAPELDLPDQSGRDVRLSDFGGRRVIVYFYPAASTPGCTAQACDFRDSLGSLAASGYAVLGVSPDGRTALEDFADEHRLTFPLLSDADGATARAWGAWGRTQGSAGAVDGLQRSTVVVDGEGRVLIAQYAVSASGHVAALRETLASM
jgi:peroxiredoxin Q/BCP